MDGATGVQLTPLPDVPRDDDGRVAVASVGAAARRVAASDAALLESVPGTPYARRWSYVVVGSGGRIRHAGGRTELRTARGIRSLPDDPFLALAERCEALDLDPHAAAPAGDEPPFQGGLLGAFGYDLARWLEELPAEAARDRQGPDLDLLEVDALVAVDHEHETAVLVERVRDDRRPEGRAHPVVAALDERGAARGPTRAGSRHVAATTTLPRGAYEAAVREVLERIRDGDTFQVNLSQRLTTRWDGDLWQLYAALRRQSAPTHGAVIPAPEGGGIASVSPETFLEVAAGSARIRPMKGTRPRWPDDPARDAAARNDLVASGKDRAENVMVVDMERNDLGRVCRPGSVSVERLCHVERHPTVWQLVSDVVGELRHDVGYADLLRATFPCGSVTGTPKVAAMELIDRLEPVRRGWYCGAIGYLGRGSALTSVAIRTAVLWPDGTVDHGAGGGVVADSDPRAEHAESLDKALAFLRAVGAVLGP